MSDGFLRQIAGDAPINAVPADNSITPQKTSFINFIGEASEEPNEITKAKTVNSISEIQAATVNSILPGHRNTYNGALEAGANYNLLKLFIKPDDVIRSKLYYFSLLPSSTSTMYYVSFFTSANTFISTQMLYGKAHASANVDILKENGLKVPANSAYCYINVFVNYYNTSNDYLYTNGKTAEIITINKDRSITYLNGITEKQPDYIPVGNNNSGEAHFEVNQDIRIPRYEERFGDIESILSSIVEV